MEGCGGKKNSDSERRNAVGTNPGIKGGGEEGKKRFTHTASAPCLFFHAMQRGNLVASSVATASDVSTASKSGVSPFAFLLMPSSSSWPASMRNSLNQDQHPSSSSSTLSLSCIIPSFAPTEPNQTKPKAPFQEKKKGKPKKKTMKLTAISTRSSRAARCREVLPLSA